MRDAISLLFVSVVVAATITPLAHAQDADDSASEASIERPEPRQLPDYDGRGEDPADPADAWLWIPRIITGPLYIISEYILRAPIGWVLTELEQSSLLPAVISYLNNDFAVLPIIVADLGLIPTVNLSAWFNHFLFEENRISASGGLGGKEVFQARIVDTVQIGDVTLSARVAGLHREDHIFGGVGPGAANTIGNRSRYTEDLFETGLAFDWRFWHRSHLRIAAGYDTRSFIPSVTFGDDSIDARQDRLAGGALPNSFVGGYSAFRSRLELIVDTRSTSPHLEGGARIAAFVENGFDVEDPSGRNWLQYGALLLLATDGLGNGRILGIEADVQLVEDLSSDGVGVPFTELIDPGGGGPLRAYVAGQLRGASAAVLTARYQWPIWVFLNGDIFVSTGSVFDDKFSGFEPDQLRYSFGLGIEVVGAGEHPFVAQLAFGSETIANGGELTSFRLLIGARNFL